MSFTIICDKCGSNQTIKEGFSPVDSKVDIYVVEVSQGYMGMEVESIDISCENFECNNTISI